MNNLIIAAHPDDEILGCGGTIARYGQIHDFYVLILTGGAETRYDKSMESMLRKHAIKANSILGTKDVFFEKLPNQGLDNIALTDVIQVIEKHIDRLKPDNLFIHSSQDLNKDHRIVYEAGITASRPFVGQAIHKVFSYFVASSTEWNRIDNSFIPNTYIDIKGVLEKKIEAMKSYKSECKPYPHPRSSRALSIYATFWGLSVGMECVEPFQLIQDLSGRI